MLLPESGSWLSAQPCDVEDNEFGNSDVLVHQPPVRYWAGYLALALPSLNFDYSSFKLPFRRHRILIITFHHVFSCANFR